MSQTCKSNLQAEFKQIELTQSNAQEPDRWFALGNQRWLMTGSGSPALRWTVGKFCFCRCLTIRRSAVAKSTASRWSTSNEVSFLSGQIGYIWFVRVMRCSRRTAKGLSRWIGEQSAALQEAYWHIATNVSLSNRLSGESCDEERALKRKENQRKAHSLKTFVGSDLEMIWNRFDWIAKRH